MHRRDSSRIVTGTPALNQNQRGELRKTAHRESGLGQASSEKHKQFAIAEMFAQVGCQLSVAYLRIEGHEARPHKGTQNAQGLLLLHNIL